MIECDPFFSAHFFFLSIATPGWAFFLAFNPSIGMRICFGWSQRSVPFWAFL
jgi:hypothetical protein